MRMPIYDGVIPDAGPDESAAAAALVVAKATLIVQQHVQRLGCSGQIIEY